MPEVGPSARHARERRGALSVAAIVATLAALAADARAQQSGAASAADASANDIAAARELGVEGIKAAQEGKCPEAIDLLTRATKLYLAPTLFVPLADCLVSVGRLVEGSEVYQRVLRDPLPANAPRAFVDAQQRAKTQLNATMPKIAKLQIFVEPEGINPIVTVDQQPVPAVLIGTYRPTDPGTRTVEATAKGYKKASATVKLGEGGRDTVKLKLEFDPTGGPLPADPVNQEGSNPSKEIVVPPLPGEGESSKGLDPLRTTGFVALGIGAVGIGIGVGFAVAAGSASDSDTSDHDKTISTISFIGGGVLAASGLILVVVTSGSPAPPQRKPATTTKLHVEPTVGWKSAGLVGTF